MQLLSVQPDLPTLRPRRSVLRHFPVHWRTREKAETVESKLHFLRQIHPTLANLRVGVRIRPGTPVAQAAVQEGLITDESDLISPTFYLEKSVREWIVDRLKREADANPTVESALNVCVPELSTMIANTSLPRGEIIQQMDGTY